MATITPILNIKPGAYYVSPRLLVGNVLLFLDYHSPRRHLSTFSVDHTIKEIKYLVKLGIKEIFDDTGTFPVGPWLDKFCHQMIRTGLNKR